MVVAYIFVVLKSGEENNILNAKLLKGENIKDMTRIYGMYDLVIKVDFKNMKELYNFISSLRKINGVGKTSTMISV